jgi:hypothetical protein
MGAVEQIQEQLLRLSPDKQREVLDFVKFLQEQMGSERQFSGQRSMRQHPAFGSWRERHIDPLEYQDRLRSEWDDRA